MTCDMLTFCTSKKQVTYFDHVLVLILTDKMKAFKAAICKHFHENGILKREFSFITHKSKPNWTLPSFSFCLTSDLGRAEVIWTGFRRISLRWTQLTECWQTSGSRFADFLSLFFPILTCYSSAPVYFLLSVLRISHW